MSTIDPIQQDAAEEFHPVKVLAIGYVWPEPNSSAAGTYMMSLLKAFLTRDWQVTFASAAARTQHMLDLSELGIESVDIKLNCSSFDDFIRQLQPDIVLFDRFMIEEQFGWRVEKNCPDALRLLDTEDLHFLRNARHAAYKEKRELCPADLQSDMAIREVSAILRCDMSFIISDVEYQMLQQRYNIDKQLLHMLPFMLSLPETPLPAFEQRHHFVSIGNFRHAPNWDSVLWMKQQIWPLIRRQMPNAQLQVYGAYPPPKATKLNAPEEGFNVLGWVDDANEAMRNARVCLAPLRFGAGIKGKLAEAMLNGTPNVTTNVGAEAMAGGLAWSGFIGEEPQQIADQAVKLYNDELLWLQCRENGFSIIERNFNKTILQQKMLEAVDYQLENLQALRQKNFTGAILRHHIHKSTQYMSQWIEAKNSK